MEYIINKKQDNKNNNEVHTTECAHLPESLNQVSLGAFDNGEQAVKYAEEHGYPNADGCYHCCNEAHHG